jgi:hypothetical protein
MKKCPRCGLPPEGEFECHYCGLVFNDELKSNIFQNKIKELDWFQLRQKILTGFIIFCVLFLIWHYVGRSFWITALIMIVILYFIFQWYNIRSKKSGIKKLTKAEGQKIIDDNIVWLKKRWDRVQKEKESGVLMTLNWWYFDEATDRQLTRIKRIGVDISRAKITKGQASDLIGLFEPADAKDMEILKMHSIPLAGMNQTKAREHVAKIRNEPEKIRNITKT